MAIERFVWTDHALLRLAQRGLARFEVEDAIREAHQERIPNDGKADWLISIREPGGGRLEVIYDHPAQGNELTARIVSVWRTD